MGDTVLAELHITLKSALNLIQPLPSLLSQVFKMHCAWSILFTIDISANAVCVFVCV